MCSEFESQPRGSLNIHSTYKASFSGRKKFEYPLALFLLFSFYISNTTYKMLAKSALEELILFF